MKMYYSARVMFSFRFLVTAIAIIICTQSFAQNLPVNVTDDWYLLDYEDDNVVGLSAHKAYKKLLKRKKADTVVVAVIDSGIDIDHEDLAAVIWRNLDEVGGNGVDDDGNGYVDDVYGWNFLGGPDGNVYYDTYEFVRVLQKLTPGFQSGDLDSVELATYLNARAYYDRALTEHEENLAYLQNLSSTYDHYAMMLKDKLQTDSLVYEDLKRIDPADSAADIARRFMGLVHVFYGTVGSNVFKQDAEELMLDYANFDMNTDFRTIVNDSLPYYGNADVDGPDPSHGTHVAGIIGAIRNNKLGMDGIAPAVKIMPIRAVPNGDERDMDVANAIRYAVDNGAKVINMSFGKNFSPEKYLVDSAARYAGAKGVLLIHGAGNEHMNIDSVGNYPNRLLNNGTELTNWIEVGATFATADVNLVAEFSNYGKHQVDIFAPGVHIFSTTPDNTYEHYDGTSMAAPMVTGLAALLWSYYPQLTMLQVRQIILESAIPYGTYQVRVPGGDSLVEFSELSKTGSVINVYNAVLMAEELTAAQPDNILKN